MINQNKQKQNGVWIETMCFLSLMILFLLVFLFLARSTSAAIPQSSTQLSTTIDQSTTTFPPPCTLSDITCPYEEKTIQAVVTAYDCYGQPRCIAADGTKPVAFRMVACPRMYNFDERIWIKGLPEFKCGDRTNTKFNGRFDIFFGSTKESHEAALKFGKQVLPIQILN